MKDRKITVVWCMKSNTYDITAQKEENNIRCCSYVSLSLTAGEMMQFKVLMIKEGIARVKAIKEKEREDNESQL